jgi:hypothetical protein
MNRYRPAANDKTRCTEGVGLLLSGVLSVVAETKTSAQDVANLHAVTSVALRQLRRTPRRSAELRSTQSGFFNLARKRRPCVGSALHTRDCLWIGGRLSFVQPLGGLSAAVFDGDHAWAQQNTRALYVISSTQREVSRWRRAFDCLSRRISFSKDSARASRWPTVLFWDTADFEAPEEGPPLWLKRKWCGPKPRLAGRSVTTDRAIARRGGKLMAMIQRLEN